MVAARIRAAAKREPLRKAHLTVLCIFYFFCAPRLLWKNVTSQRATYLPIFLRQKNYLRTASHLWRCRQERAPEGSKSHRATHLSIFLREKNIFDEKKKSRRGSKKAKKLPNLLDSDIITFCFKNIDSNNVFNRFCIQIIEKAALVKTSGKHT